MIKVYDQHMQLVAYLENAFTVGYEMPFNSLWRASFSLPANDEKNAECIAFRYVEIYDEHERLDLYRILPTSAKRANDGATITYQCEHVLATLIDDVMFQNHTVGNLGYYTSNVIAYILSKQIVAHWQLGTVSFARQFEYNWENDNLLAALFSVPKPFTEEYMWTWDTSSYPWTLNLVEPPQELDAYIRYGVNMQGITKDEDPTELCTRLYCLGYGEGVNQLSITEVNNGVPYLEADTLSLYGFKSKVWADRRFTNPVTLMARGQAILDELKTPRTTYTVDATDLSSITNDPLDKFKTGYKVRVIDEELGIDVIFRVANKSKGDIWGDPGAVRLEIANRTQDISTSLANLQDRQRINETYAQGATNVNIYDLAENCDPTHPAKFRIWVPEEAVRINKVLLTYENEPFRANSKAIEGGGAGVNTSEAGDYDEIMEHKTLGFVGSNVRTDISGEHYHKLEIKTAGNHYHIVDLDTGISDYDGSHDHSTSYSDEHDGHIHFVDDHEHYMRLIPHTHDIELPDHTHDIEFGIYEGPTASAVGLVVDGNNVGGPGVSETNIDLVDYLELDDEGKIKRGQWHTIEIVPNTLSRIVANVVIQFFVQSRGGGDY